MYEYIKLEGAPFDDEQAVYNDKKHHYEVLSSWIKNKFGNGVFGSMKNEDVEDLMEETNESIKDYIQSETYRGTYDVIEYRIAKADFRGEYKARQDFIDAVVAQVKYALRSGGDMLGDHHGVNLKKGTKVDNWREERKYLEVSSRVDRILRKRENPLIAPYSLCYELDPDDYRSDY